MAHWELLARESIRDLVASYAHLADGGRFDDLVALFTEGGSLRIDDREPLVGRAAIRAFLGGTGASLKTATTTRRLIRHHVSNHRITVAGPSDATGASYFFVVTDRGPDHWGRYRDAYACVGGHWLFAERRVRVEGFGPDSWAAERRRALERG